MQIGPRCVAQFHYTLTDDAGTVIDSSRGGDPLTYLHGGGNIVPGLEKMMEGKVKGDAFKADVSPEEGYGPRIEALLQTAPRSMFPPDMEPAVGMQFQAESNMGPVMVTVEYQIDPADAAAFAAVMRQTRRARLGQGALSWGLFKDTSAPGRYIEYFVDESWLEHQRRLERFSVVDAGLRAPRTAFHKGSTPPLVRRYVAEALRRTNHWPW